MIKLAQLMELARHSGAVTHGCGCAATPLAGWERVPLSFPETQMRLVGTLAEDPLSEASYQEYHPAGTHYWSEDAPVALRYFPYNRCAVAQCIECGRAYLRYTEGGGYYVELRIRALIPALIVDVV